MLSNNRISFFGIILKTCKIKITQLKLNSTLSGLQVYVIHYPRVTSTVIQIKYFQDF